jgi:ABC-type glycerol-3-phosphate transport system substrate-binding protein
MLGMAGVVALLAGWRRRGLRLVAMMLLAVGFVAGCGGSNAGGGSGTTVLPPDTGTVTVTAAGSAGGVTQTVALSVTVE